MMFTWLHIQYLYIYFSAFISMVVFCIYSSMNNKASGKMKEIKKEKVQREQEKIELDKSNADIEMTKFNR